MNGMNLKAIKQPTYSKIGLTCRHACGWFIHMYHDPVMGWTYDGYVIQQHMKLVHHE